MANRDNINIEVSLMGMKSEITPDFDVPVDLHSCSDTDIQNLTDYMLLSVLMNTILSACSNNNNNNNNG
jgi:hypothetical protein